MAFNDRHSAMTIVDPAPASLLPPRGRLGKIAVVQREMQGLAAKARVIADQALLDLLATDPPRREDRRPPWSQLAQPAGFPSWYSTMGGDRIVGERFWIYASRKKGSVAGAQWPVRSADNIVVPRRRRGG